MEDRAEHRGVDLLAHLVVDAQPRHGVEVEAQRAGHVAEKGRRRERRLAFGRDEAFERRHHGGILGHLDGGRLCEVHVDADLDPRNGQTALVVYLVDVAARLARGLVVGMGAIEHPDIRRALDQAVEIVGVDPFVVLGRGQREGRTQVVGDERPLSHEVAGEVVVVHREQQHVLEVEVARLEDTHDLNALERFALKGDADGLQVAAQQRGVDLRRQLHVARIERVA